MNKHFFSWAFIFLAFFIFSFPPFLSEARIGVGVGTAKIEINEDLKPGGIYQMPPLVVRNNGDEAGEYGVRVQFQSDVPELKPEKDWFSFSPEKFTLAPGGSETVAVTLRIPVKAEPGKYFSYAEAYPASTVTRNDGAVIGIAAAAKVYFTVTPANIWQSLYYKLLYLWKFYAPWTYVGAVIILVAMLIAIFKGFFTFKIGIGKKKKEKIVLEENDNSDPKDVVIILHKSLQKVDEYTSHMTEEQLENVFREARLHKKEVVDFFYRNDSTILQKVSPKLREILVLSKNGAVDIEKNHPEFFREALKTIVSGLVG